MPDKDPDLGKLDTSTPAHIVRLENQKFWVRWAVLAIAIIVMVAYGILEFWLLQRFFGYKSVAEGPFTFLLLSPILGITVIVTALLIGAFRGFKSDDANYMSVDNIKAALGD